jgi:hypothetical protein
VTRILASLLLAAATALIPAQAVAQTSDSVLRRLSPTLDGARLEGEVAVRRWAVYLTAEEALRPARFEILAESAVSVMPEASRLTLSVNGKPGGETPIGGAWTSQPTILPMTPGLLHAGWNTLVLTARQRHRVDCSVDATYELWTRLSPAATGLRLAGPPARITGFADLPALPLDIEGRLPIRLRTGVMTPRLAGPAMAAIAALAQAAGAAHPVVDVDPLPGSGEGLDVLLVSGEASQRLPAPFSLEAGEGRPVVTLAAATPEVLETAVAALSAALRREARPSPAAVPLVTGGETKRFGELGVDSQTFDGRRWEVSAAVAFPADMLAADYASVRLDLSAGYAAGLSPTAQLSVTVNGKPSAAVQMGARTGGLLGRRAISLPLSAFRPGLNRITLSAVLPAPADAVCDPRAQIAGPERFALLDSSTLQFPTMARIGRFPDIGRSFAPHTGAMAPRTPIFQLGRLDASTLAAAATLHARMSQTGRPGAIPVVAERAPLGSDPVIVVGTALDLSRNLLAGAGVPAATVAMAWNPRARAAAQVARAREVDRELVTGSVGKPTVATSTPSNPADVMSRWRAQQGLDTTSLRARVVAFAGGIVAWLSPTPVAALPVGSSTDLVMAQSVASGTGQITTVVTAPTPSALVDGTALLTAPATWNGLSGRAVLLELDSAKTTIVPAESAWLLGDEPLDLVNLRLLIAAWLSLNAPVYALLLLLAAVGFGFATVGALRRPAAAGQTEPKTSAPGGTP